MKDIEAFLKEYAGLLREEMDWSEVAPCTPSVRMAAGQVAVVDKNGDIMAVFVTRVPKEEYNPSCPISQRDIQAAKLLVEVVNYLGSSDGKET